MELEVGNMRRSYQVLTPDGAGGSSGNVAAVEALENGTEIRIGNAAEN